MSCVEKKIVQDGFVAADDGPMYAEFITVMAMNGKQEAEMNTELSDLFGAKYDPAFGTWVKQLVQHIEQGGTVAPEHLMPQHRPQEAAAVTVADADPQQDQNEQYEQYDDAAMDDQPAKLTGRARVAGNPYPAPRLFNQLTKALERNPDTLSKPRRKSIDPELGVAVPTGPKNDIAPPTGPRRGGGPVGLDRGLRSGGRANGGPLRGMNNQNQRGARGGAQMNPHMNNMNNGRMVQTPFGPIPAHVLAMATNMASMLSANGQFPAPPNTLAQRLGADPTRQTKPRCNKWPMCPYGQKCQFPHPGKVCPMFPRCPKPRGTCDGIHPGEDMPVHEVQAFITKQQKNNASNGTKTNGAGGVKKEGVSPVVSGDAPLCKYDSKCQNAACYFAHSTPAAPEGQGLVLRPEPCPSGADCADAECDRAHPSPAINKPATDGDTAMDGAAEHKEVDTRPPCKFYPDCAKGDACPFRHDANTSTTVQIPCHFGLTCTRPNCHFLHPAGDDGKFPIPCRFGARCKNDKCRYQHAPDLKNKIWTRDGGGVGTSERAFVGGEVVEKVVPGSGVGVEITIGENDVEMAA
ncbi:hypothetical protein G7K_6692-t1 [Saitoella complicata NRRL Y-17804]|uniref:C3H1-type domain-containing protein n=2 Tax=Saitoella complicata (strain BCRC 22490 / CBS 7301 / JCM 7358 / NBRC 10748 / NRRL Y-17804) TaxID=698492 RepID=A0A0E9NRW8_SAICN|nr:hypothetical protein G7K_6692-t1 [Saitoella complicata NRRL Y-17804]